VRLKRQKAAIAVIPSAKPASWMTIATLRMLDELQPKRDGGFDISVNVLEGS
jgi:hypothetical protein